MKIVHIAGTKNVMADMLSRAPLPEIPEKPLLGKGFSWRVEFEKTNQATAINAIVELKPAIKTEEWEKAQLSDPYCVMLREKLKDGNESVREFAEAGGLLYWNGRATRDGGGQTEINFPRKYD